MSYDAFTHLGYLAISISLTIWVASTLRRNGRRFLVDVFGEEPLADSVNHLLVVGFYLINLGYIALALKIADPVTNPTLVIESLSTRVGRVLLMLGAMHFGNLFVFSRMRARAAIRTTQPPVFPDHVVQAAK